MCTYNSGKVVNIFFNFCASQVVTIHVFLFAIFGSGANRGKVEKVILASVKYFAARFCKFFLGENDFFTPEDDLKNDAP